MLSATFFNQEKPKKIVPHKYSDKEYSDMRDTIAESMKSILAYLNLMIKRPIFLQIIKVCFKNMYESVKYAFNNNSNRPIQLYDKNFADAYQQVYEEIGRMRLEPNELQTLQAKLVIINQSYNEQIKYLRIIEDQTEKENRKK